MRLKLSLSLLLLTLILPARYAQGTPLSLLISSGGTVVVSDKIFSAFGSVSSWTFLVSPPAASAGAPEPATSLLVALGLGAAAIPKMRKRNSLLLTSSAAAPPRSAPRR